MVYFKRLLLYITFITNNVHSQIRQGDFRIFNNVEYIGSMPNNTIANLTGQSVSVLSKCTRRCLEYTLCQTATYYIQIQRCLLYREKYGIGTLNYINNGTASVISLTYRNPLGNRQ